MAKDISNAYLVTTGDGDLMVNTGFMDNADRNVGLLAPHRTGPMRRIILTQSHADHFGGVPEFSDEGTQVIGGPGYAENWADMKRLQPFFGPRSAKLWSGTLNRGSAPKRPPEVTPDLIVEGRHAFEQGGRRFELLHTPEGETTDGLTVWMPDERIAFTGNLFGPVFLAMPFLCTIRGDKPRSVRSYLKSLETVRDLGAEMLITGHGDPITGADRIAADLDRMHAAVSWVRDYTLDGMNAGRTVHELMRDIALPENLTIGEFHGKVSWAVRTIWEEYAGWFRYEDGTTALYGVPRSAVHGDLAQLAGGAGPLADRAAEYVAENKPLQALHLTDIALDAEPEHEGALIAKKAALEALLAASGGSNLSETMWLKAEIGAVEKALGTP
ncbi:MBL fold metallo-hydrolase [Sphingosinithalassobacter tenebrarum]|uniref:MBL fold metallo-hydrolase n=2 Tax=Stakelama tenebrarum TaxID=2711215 RepID=A0A6G6YBJ4_9SPHN|nr:MBL fold metallo-hydrolase [Sphingosinithalassobacter tenebrarum]